MNAEECLAIRHRMAHEIERSSRCCCPCPCCVCVLQLPSPSFSITMAQKKTEAIGKGVKKPKKTKIKATASSNGSSSQSNGSHSASSALSGVAILGCVVIAIVSFTAGVFTLPALSFQRAYKGQQRYAPWLVVSS